MKTLTIFPCCIFIWSLLSAQKGFDYNPGSTDATIITARQETENAIWIGTNNGLWRINKTNHKIVHLATDNSVLPSNHVTAITTSAKNNVYAATDKGIFRFDGYAYLAMTTENSDLPDSKITSMVCDKFDNLWVGTADNGLILIHYYKCTFFNVSNSVLTCNNVKEVIKDNEGNVYAVLANKDKVKINADERILVCQKE